MFNTFVQNSKQYHEGSITVEFIFGLSLITIFFAIFMGITSAFILHEKTTLASNSTCRAYSSIENKKNAYDYAHHIDRKSILEINQETLKMYQFFKIFLTFHAHEDVKIQREFPLYNEELKGGDND